MKLLLALFLLSFTNIYCKEKHFDRVLEKRADISNLPDGGWCEQRDEHDECVPAVGHDLDRDDAKRILLEIYRNQILEDMDEPDEDED